MQQEDAGLPGLVEYKAGYLSKTNLLKYHSNIQEEDILDMPEVNSPIWIELNSLRESNVDSYKSKICAFFQTATDMNLLTTIHMVEYITLKELGCLHFNNRVLSLLFCMESKCETNRRTAYKRLKNINGFGTYQYI